ncbi:glycosyltransferase family 4 protein [Qipengyuania marisflavi]|nr:glycosyltransferase family 4 protein [Qipengyuania marisflavi]
MKVLHVCETATGGIATYLKMFDTAAPAGARSSFLVPESQTGHFPQDAALRPYAGGRSAGGLAAMVAAMRRAIREDRPDVLFFHSSFSLLALLALRTSGSRIPALYCPHGWAVSRLETQSGAKGRAIRLVEGRLAGLADAVVNISAHDARLAHELGYRGRHVVIENAVSDSLGEADPPPFAKAAGEIHLLFVGRFDRQKGTDLLVSAFDRAAKQRPELRLHLVGGGVLGDQDLAIPDSIHQAGWVGGADIDRWYAAAHALIVPSRWEGFGLVVPEAYRNGTPVLVSDRGALPDLVESGATGVVFPLDRIEEHLLALDGAALAAMRPACRAQYESRFTSERWAGELAALLEDIMRARR